MQVKPENYRYYDAATNWYKAKDKANQAACKAAWGMETVDLYYRKGQAGFVNLNEVRASL